MFEKATLPTLFAGLVILSATAAASPLCVKASEANLRDGPGTQYGKTWKVYKYMPLDRVDRRGKWYQVRDLDGDRHWVYADLVSSGLRCAVVKAKEANVRRGPGTRYGRTDISPVEKYYSFRVTGGKGDWVKVRDEVGNEGWVARSMLWQP